MNIVLTVCCILYKVYKLPNLDRLMHWTAVYFEKERYYICSFVVSCSGLRSEGGRCWNNEAANPLSIAKSWIVVVREHYFS
jgi:hypothetical protein